MASLPFHSRCSSISFFHLFRRLEISLNATCPCSGNVVSKSLKRESKKDEYYRYFATVAIAALWKTITFHSKSFTLPFKVLYAGLTNVKSSHLLQKEKPAREDSLSYHERSIIHDINFPNSYSFR